MDCNRDKMFRKLFLVTLLVFATFASATAQKKEMAQAKAAIKAGKAVEAEASMRTLPHRQPPVILSMLLLLWRPG